MVQYPTKLLAGNEEWLAALTNEIKEASGPRRGQSVLVICRDMNTAEATFKRIKTCIGSDKLVSYWRDDTQSLPNQSLGTGKVIVRGTQVQDSAQMPSRRFAPL